MMPEAWRLIPCGEGTGLEHMAIDNWLLEQVVQGGHPPTLRFYTWRSPTISLGYHQKQFPAHWNNLSYNGQLVDLVRRPTGGRAVLHHGDLTYSLVMSGLHGSRREVYQQLCQFLIEGWRKLGVELNFGVAGRGYIKNPNCFGTSTAADLVTHDGYKLIGSAQVYREGCVLQHGSIRLQPDGALFETVFGEKISPPNLAEKNLAVVVDALVEAASQNFQAFFSAQPLTLAEINAALIARPTRLDLTSSSI